VFEDRHISFVILNFKMRVLDQETFFSELSKLYDQRLVLPLGFSCGNVITMQSARA